jgi:hypothetical protein
LIGILGIALRKQLHLAFADWIIDLILFLMLLQFGLVRRVRPTIQTRGFDVVPKQPREALDQKANIRP